MTKVKVKSHQSKFVVTAHLGWKERVQEEQAAILRNQYVKGLMHLSNVSGKTLAFSAPADMQLGKMLCSGIDRVCFFQMIVQLVNVLRWLNSQKLPVSHLELNMDYVYANSVTKELFFIYYPIESEEVRGNLRSFLERLVYDSSFGAGVDMDFKQELMHLIQSDININTHKLEKYVMTYCPEAGAGITKALQGDNRMISDSKSEYLRQMSERQQTRNSNGMAGTDIFYSDSPTHTEQNTETTVLNEDAGTTVLNGGGTVVLDHSEYDTPPAPCLIRKRTGEQIQIDKPVFRIGKEEGYVDYLIPDNPAVSRSHADIISRDGKYYIYDNNSTNRTYVNNIMIPALKNIEIDDATNIRLADEEFEFRVFCY